MMKQMMKSIAACVVLLKNAMYLIDDYKGDGSLIWKAEAIELDKRLETSQVMEGPGDGRCHQ